jgi:hypothetical protein
MLRDLSVVLKELQQGMLSVTGRAGGGLRICRAEMQLPVDASVVFKDGGCRLLADVTRNYADAAWREAASRLSVNWAELPLEEQP